MRRRTTITRKGTGKEISQGEPQVEVVHVEEDVPPLEENAYLPNFTPECAYLLLQGVY